MCVCACVREREGGREGGRERRGGFLDFIGNQNYKIAYQVRWADKNDSFYESIMGSLYIVGKNLSEKIHMQKIIQKMVL